MRRGTKVQLTSLLGLLAASYAMYVEMKMDVNPDYEAACDLGSFASCTKVILGTRMLGSHDKNATRA